MTNVDRFSSSRSDGVVIVSLHGELDLANVGAVRSIAQQALDAPHVARIVVDLADVAFMDSTILGALVALRTDADRCAIGLALRNVQPLVRRLLTITGLDGVFAVEEQICAPNPQRG